MSLKVHFGLVKGDFINYNLDGVLITNRVFIKVNNRGEAYIMVPRNISQAFYTISASADILIKVLKWYLYRAILRYRWAKVKNHLGVL